MNKINRFFLNFIIFGGILTSVFDLKSKSLMPGLERIKTKVENALNGPKTSFKKFLEKAQNATSQIFINGKKVDELNAEAEKKAYEKEICEIEACFNNLYWCKQEKFVEELSSTTDLLKTLKDKFVERYKDNKAPLFKFVKELSDEAELLSMTKDKIEKSIDTAKKFEDFFKKYVELSIVLTRYNETLNKIIKLTEEL